jgi:hypothetical protein
MKTKLTDSLGRVSKGLNTVHPSGWAKNSTSAKRGCSILVCSGFKWDNSIQKKIIQYGDEPMCKPYKSLTVKLFN